jgi:anti-sigma regulatory factor (Ser/Thr protein kinase)
VTAANGNGFVHAAGLYGSDDEFMRTVVPFCAAGVRRGEPTLVRVAPEKQDLLRSALGPQDGVAFLPHGEQYANPPGALANAVELIDRHTRGGRQRVRLLGELPALQGIGSDAWIRYEAAANQVLRSAPVVALCPFDVRLTPEPVLDELLRTHHAVAADDGEPVRNACYEPPERFMARRADVADDPVFASASDMELRDPAPAVARQAVGRLVTMARLDPEETGGLLVAVSEVVTNALRHGRPPVTVQAWVRPGRVVVVVHDLGHGPAEPFAGLLPVEPGAQIGGLGLWIAHQLCPEIALSTSRDGFTVSLGAGHGRDAARRAGDA